MLQLPLRCGRPLGLLPGRSPFCTKSVGNVPELEAKGRGFDLNHVADLLAFHPRVRMSSCPNFSRFFTGSVPCVECNVRSALMGLDVICLLSRDLHILPSTWWVPSCVGCRRYPYSDSHDRVRESFVFLSIGFSTSGSISKACCCLAAAALASRLSNMCRRRASILPVVRQSGLSAHQRYMSVPFVL